MCGSQFKSGQYRFKTRTGSGHGLGATSIGSRQVVVRVSVQELPVLIFKANAVFAGHGLRATSIGSRQMFLSGRGVRATSIGSWSRYKIYQHGFRQTTDIHTGHGSRTTSILEDK